MTIILLLPEYLGLVGCRLIALNAWWSLMLGKSSSESGTWDSSTSEKLRRLWRLGISDVDLVGAGEEEGPVWLA
jgi:hypothetical protein